MANTYSFLNVNAAIAGPGGAVNMGSGAAIAEEGITISPNADKNIMTIGADGGGQHSLVADDSGKVTVRALKTSPLNAALMAMYNIQSSASSLWGVNVITVFDPARGDLHTCQLCAFNKKPEINYKKEGDLIEWVFDSLKITSILGT